MSQISVEQQVIDIQNKLDELLSGELRDDKRIENIRKELLVCKIKVVEREIKTLKRRDFVDLQEISKKEKELRILRDDEFFDEMYDRRGCYY